MCFISNTASLPTIVDRSMMYTSLVLLVGIFPPNSTARWSSIMVREKNAQGVGLVPLILGEDHFPKMEDKWLFFVLLLLLYEQLMHLYRDL